jgi:hypothetical protein
MRSAFPGLSNNRQAEWPQQARAGSNHEGVERLPTVIAFTLIPFLLPLGAGVFGSHNAAWPLKTR